MNTEISHGLFEVDRPPGPCENPARVYKYTMLRPRPKSSTHAEGVSPTHISEGGLRGECEPVSHTTGFERVGVVTEIPSHDSTSPCLSSTITHPRPLCPRIFEFWIESRHPVVFARSLRGYGRVTGRTRVRRLTTPFNLDVLTVIVDFLPRGEWLYVILTGDTSQDWRDFVPNSICRKHSTRLPPLVRVFRHPCGCLLSQVCHSICAYSTDNVDYAAFDRVLSRAEIRALLVIGGVEQNPGPVKYAPPDPKQQSAKPPPKKHSPFPTMNMVGLHAYDPGFPACGCAVAIHQRYRFTHDAQNVYVTSLVADTHDFSVQKGGDIRRFLHQRLCPRFGIKHDYPKHEEIEVEMEAIIPPPKLADRASVEEDLLCLKVPNTLSQVAGVSPPKEDFCFLCGDKVCDSDLDCQSRKKSCYFHKKCMATHFLRTGRVNCLHADLDEDPRVYLEFEQIAAYRFAFEGACVHNGSGREMKAFRAPAATWPDWFVRSIEPNPAVQFPLPNPRGVAPQGDEMNSEQVAKFIALKPHLALGITRDDDDARVVMRRRVLCLKYHPDKHAGCDSAMQALISAAFVHVMNSSDLLDTPGKRRLYFSGRGPRARSVSPSKRRGPDKGYSTGTGTTHPPKPGCKPAASSAPHPPSHPPPKPGPHPGPATPPATGPTPVPAAPAPAPAAPFPAPVPVPPVVFAAPAVLAAPVVVHVVAPVPRARLYEYSSEHRCSMFVWRLVWDFVLSDRYTPVMGFSPIPGPPRSRARLAAMVSTQKAFVRKQMDRRKRLKMGGVVANVDQSCVVYGPGRLANARREDLDFNVPVMDFSTRELRDWCDAFGVPFQRQIAGAVFVDCDAHTQHTGVYLSAAEHRVSRDLVRGFFGVGTQISTRHARVGLQNFFNARALSQPVISAISLVNGLRTSPLMSIGMIIEPHDYALPKLLVHAIVNPGCPTHSTMYEEGSRIVNSRFLQHATFGEKEVLPSPCSSALKRRGIIGNIKFMLGIEDVRAGSFQGPKPCCCITDPITELQHNISTEHPGRSTLIAAEYDAFINSIVPLMAGMNSEAVRAYTNTRIAILAAKHPFDNQGMLNQAMEYDPAARLRLCRDNTLQQIIHDCVQYRVATLDARAISFIDIVLDGRKCYTCESTRTHQSNGVDVCARHDNFRVCPNCFIPHAHGCPLDAVSREPTQCGCGGGGCKKCRIFDTCERCGCVRCTRFRGKKTEKYCPKCTGGVPGILHPILRTGYGMILHDTIVPTTSFALPRVPGHKQGLFADPVTRLTALIDGKWVDVRDTRNLCETSPNRTAGSTLYGLAWVQSLPAVATLDLKSLLHSMVTRQLKDQVPASPGYFAVLEHFVRNNMETLFGPKVDIVPTPFSEWVARFPPGRQAQLRKALSNIRNARFNLKQSCERIIFGKNEKLEKASFKSTSSDFSCRVISSLAGYEPVVILGPWMHAFGNHLKHVFRQGSCVTTACGMDAIGLGECFHEASKLPKRLDADHSKFDSTIHYRLLQIERLVYDYFGVSNDKKRARVLDYQLQSKYSIKMSVNGRIQRVARGRYYGRRNSGDPNTTTGNTILNAVCTIHAAFRASGCTTFEEFYDPRRFRIWVIGDDLMMACAEGHVDFQAFRRYHAESGLILEVNERGHASELTFCGARSVPARVNGVQGRISIPQFERWMTKIGWSRDPQPSAEAYVRGLVCGWRGSIGSVPLFSDVLNTMWRCTSGPAKHFRKTDDGYNQKFVSDRNVVEVDENAVVDVAIGLHVTTDLVQLWRQIVRSVPSLPCVISLPGSDAIVP